MNKIEVTKLKTEYHLRAENGLEIRVCCHAVYHGNELARLTVCPAHKEKMDKFWFEESKPELVEGLALLILEACKIAKEEGK